MRRLIWIFAWRTCPTDRLFEKKVGCDGVIERCIHVLCYLNAISTTVKVLKLLKFTQNILLRGEKDNRIEPVHYKIYSKTCDQRRLRSACASAQFDQSSLIACTFYSLQAIQRQINENPCSSAWMYRLIWIFAGYVGLIVGFVERWLSYQYVCLIWSNAIS